MLDSVPDKNISSSSSSNLRSRLRPTQPKQKQTNRRRRHGNHDNVTRAHKHNDSTIVTSSDNNQQLDDTVAIGQSRRAANGGHDASVAVVEPASVQAITLRR